MSDALLTVREYLSNLGSPESRQVARECQAAAAPDKVDRTGTLRAGDISVSLDELFTAVEAEINS